MSRRKNENPLVGLLRDETGGEKDNINTLLIMALIVLPLLVLLIAFKDNVLEFFQGEVEETFQKGKDAGTYKEVTPN